MPESQKTDDTRISWTPGRPKKSKIEQAFHDSHSHTFTRTPLTLLIKLDFTSLLLLNTFHIDSCIGIT